MKKCWSAFLFYSFFLVFVGRNLNAQISNDPVVNAKATPQAFKEYGKDTVLVNKREFGINVNQSSFSKSWSGGTKSAISLGAFLNLLRETRRGKNSWRYDFQSQYGIIKTGGQTSRKSVDRVFFDLKYGRRLAPEWSFIGNFNFLSQFGSGYTYSTLSDGTESAKKISGPLAPAFLTEAIGFEYKPVPYFFVDFLPGAVKQTIVADKGIFYNTPDTLNYGVKKNRLMRNEVALIQLVANFEKDIAKNTNLKFRYMMYARYDLAAVDHRLDAMLTAKVNKYINVNLGVIMIYDEDQGKKLQLAQSLALGFLYTF
jgi:hypothetical protein